MIIKVTKRLKIMSNIKLCDGKIIFQPAESDINIFKITKTSGLENGFISYINDCEICHIGFQNHHGYLEISYGTNEAYRRNGYMSEMLPIVMDWLFKETLEDCVHARVNKDNAQSERILTNNKFIKYDDCDGTLIYKLKKENW